MAVQKVGGKIIRLLIINDSADEAEQVIDALRQFGYRLKTHRVDKAPALEAALDGKAGENPPNRQDNVSQTRKKEWDIVLAEFSAFEAQRVSALIQQRGLQVPVIVLAEKITDDDLCQAIHAGARDVVVKGQWTHLMLALERELRMTAEHRAYTEAVEALRQMENRYRVMIEGAREAVCYCHQGMHVDANPAYLLLFGYNDLSQLKAVPFLNLVDEADRVRFTFYLRQPESWTEPQELFVVNNSGVKLPVEVTISPINIAGEDCLQIGVTDISGRKALEDKLQHLRQRDALTGLYNRPYFLQELSKVIERVKSGGALSTLLGLELHGLRGINETLGHAACDQMLLLLTRYLREKVDDSALLARVGGGQFAVLLEGKAGNETNQIKEKIGEVVKALQSGKGGKGLEYIFTLNLITIDKTTDDRHKLLRTIYPAHQETGLEQVSHSPPNEKVCVPAIITPAPATATPSKTELDPRAQPADEQTSKNPPNEEAGGNPPNEKQRQAARTMLEQSDFHLLFQPIINMYGNQHGFYEALLCIKTGNGDLIPATELMLMAERCGLAGSLDRWLAQHAIEALAKLSRQGKKPGKNRPNGVFFISFSNAAINDSKLVSDIQRHLKVTGLNAAQLLFQLDASLLLKQNNAVTMFIRQIKKMGAGVVIDKFNHEIAKQSRLTSLEIDFVKINCPLAPGTQVEVIDISMVRDAISIAKSLKKKTIVNGIENAESLSLLWNYGVDYIQGGYLCPANHEPDYDFDNEHTLDSKQPVSTLWQVTG